MQRIALIFTILLLTLPSVAAAVEETAPTDKTSGGVKPVLSEAMKEAMARQGMTEADFHFISDEEALKLFPDFEQRQAELKQALELYQAALAASKAAPTAASPERARIAHIFLKVPQDAAMAQKAEIRKKLEAIRVDIAAEKITFAAAAAKYSEDANTAEKGGDMGYVPRGDVPKSFADAVFNAMPGTVTPVLESESGYHIIMKIDN